MEDITKKKLFAAAKIGGGVARIGSAIATATGHGVFGGLTKNPGTIRAITPWFKHSVLRGKEMIVEGIADLKEAQRHDR